MKPEDVRIRGRPRPAFRRIAWLSRPRPEAAHRRGRRAGGDAEGHARARRRPRRPPPRRSLASVVSEYLSDDERARMEKGRSTAIVGRDREADEILDTLVRIKGKAPVLIAPPGSKSTIARRAAAAGHRRETIRSQTLPAHAGARALGRDHAEPADGAHQRQQSRRPQAGGRALLRRRAGDREEGKDPHRRVHRRFPYASTAIRSRR